MSNEYSEDGWIEQAIEDVLIELGWEVKTAWTKESFGQLVCLEEKTNQK